MWGFFYFLINQLFPLQCVLCGIEDVKICNKCLAKIHAKPQWSKFSGINVWTSFEYKNKLAQTLVKKWKYSNDKELLTHLVDKAVFPDISKYNLIIPVPLHRRRFIERGFNQAEQFAQSLVDDVNSDLHRSRYTKPQAQLEKDERVINLQDAFVWRGCELKGKKCLLIDDVVTTGSTLKESSTALFLAGADQVDGLCLFRGE